MIDLRLRIPSDVKSWVQEEAARDQRSQNSQIIWVLRQAMAAQAALNNVEAGASVSQTSAPASSTSPETIHDQCHEA